MLRYGLYTRKSDKDDADTIKSIEDQKSFWLERALQNNLHIARVYEENRSAMVPGTRPIYKQMLADLKAGRINGVLVWHVNRLARNVEEGGAFSQMLIDGIIQEVRSPNSVYTPADNILPLLIEQGSAAQFSRDLSRANTFHALQTAKTGGCPRKCPIGYLNARDPLNLRRGIVLPDPERFPLVRRGLEMRLTGLYTKKQVIDAMNSWGLRTRPTDKSPSKPLHASRGYALFADPFYAGFVLHKGALHKGRHTPMLSADEYVLLQQLNAREQRTNPRRRTFAFTGLMRCGFCGHQVTAEQHEKRGRRYVYYHCCDPYGRCTKRSISEPELERQIRNLLRSLSINKDLADLGWEWLRAWIGTQGKAIGAAGQRQQARLAEIDRERETLLTLMLRGAITDDALYKRKDESLVTERNQLLVGLQNSEESLRHITQQADAVLQFAWKAHEEFSMADLERKRAIAAALGIKYSLRGKELTVEIDPLLEKTVQILHQKTQSIETGFNGSGSIEKRGDLSVISFGSANANSIEIPDELLDLLRNGNFSNLFAQ